MIKKFYLFAVIVGVICATGFIFVGQKPQCPAISTPIKAEKVFPHPDHTTYNMSLYLDINNRTLYGNTVIDTVNTSGKLLDELWFTVYPNAFREAASTPAPSEAYYNGFSEGWLIVDSLKVNGKTVKHKDDIAMQAVLPASLLPNDNVQIEIIWRARIPKLAYRFGYKSGVYMLGNCYPTLNVYTDQYWHNSYNSLFGDPFCLQVADYQVNISLPDTYNLVCTGDITNKRSEDNGRTVYWVTANKVRDLCLVVTYDYQELHEKIDGYYVKCYAPNNNNDVVSHIAEQSGEILKYYASLLGSYPYSDLKVVFVPMKGFQGMEYSGLIFLREDFLNPNYDENRRQFILAHEIAHQWWYALVGNDQLQEPWLDEGLANWFAHKYLEKHQKPRINGIYLQEEVNLGKQLHEMHSAQDYYQTAYNGGEAFWSGLEIELGEERITNVLRSYMAEYEYRIATTKDLLEIINREASKDMAYYFAKWF